MSWTILVNIDGSFFKFWSYDNQSGQRHWGRIGTAGQYRTFSLSENIDKSREKISNGYRLFSNDASYSQPSPQQVRQFFSGSTESSRTLDEPVVRARTTRTRSSTPRLDRAPRALPESSHSTTEGIKVPEYNRTHTIPDVDNLKTDNNGYIKNIDNYRRISYESYSANLIVVGLAQMVDESGRILNQEYYKIANAYFKKIPKDSQYNKPDSLKELREPQRPTFGCVFYKKLNKLECVAIYGHHRAQGYCDFLAVKHDTPFRISLIRTILLRIANASPTSEVVFKIKSQDMKEAIQTTADYYSPSGQFFKYRVTDLRSGISISDERPKRWID